jgi:hypothetical protein
MHLTMPCAAPTKALLLPQALGAALTPSPPAGPPAASPAVKEYRKRRKDPVKALTEEVTAKMQQLEVLTAENQMLQVRRQSQGT